MWRALLPAMLASTAAAGPRVVIVETDALALPSLGTRVELHGGHAVEIQTLRDGRLRDPTDHAHPSIGL